MNTLSNNNNNLENDLRNVFNGLAQELKAKKAAKNNNVNSFEKRTFNNRPNEFKSFEKRNENSDNNSFEKKVFNSNTPKIEKETKSFNSQAKTFNKKVNSSNKMNKTLELIKKYFVFIFNITKKVLVFLKNKPILATTLVIIFVLLINIKVINQTILLKNIDGLKTEITTLKETQAQTNLLSEKRINELRKEIERIETENKKFNEITNLKIKKKTEELKLKVTKLTALNY